jgi:hypothetical protein
MRRRLIVAGLAGFLMPALASAWADDRLVGSASSGSPILLLPPAESGKPLIPPAPPNAGIGAPEGCLAPLPCGTKLLGAARKNGAVELQVPALRW